MARVQVRGATGSVQQWQLCRPPSDGLLVPRNPPTPTPTHHPHWATCTPAQHTGRHRVIDWARATGAKLTSAFFDRAFRTIAIAGTVDQAIGLFEDMVADGVQGTDESFTCLLQVCSKPMHSVGSLFHRVCTHTCHKARV